jgi:pyruvate dehydrogenase E1 component alpha subunit/2-oxoisovalerate dehydrogenase E1 component alpha subunit
MDARGTQECKGRSFIAVRLSDWQGALAKKRFAPARPNGHNLGGMVQAMTSREAAIEPATPRESYIEAFQWMLLARLLDDKLASLYRGGKIVGGVFLGRGQEALSVSVGLSLRKGDIFAPLIRDAAGRLAFGETLLDAVRTYFGSALGPMRGRDGNVHRGRPLEGLFAMISHLGAMISAVNGALMARRFKGVAGTVGAACVGEGASSTGAFHEAINQAAIERLPLILVVADNQYAYSTPNSRQFACRSLADKAVGYGVEVQSVDGTDLEDCLEKTSHAVAQARKGRGPQMIVARLLRLCGHGEHDDASYVDPKLKQSPLGRDCLSVAEEFILQQRWADRPTIQTWREDALRRVEEAVARVQREPGPDPFKEEWYALSSKHLHEGHTDA